MNRLAPHSVFSFATLMLCLSCANASEIVDWHFNQLSSIGGHSLGIEGKPELVESTLGSALLFDGKGDRLQINGNPVAGADQFTLELILKPLAPLAAGREPRIIHIENASRSDHRITIEMRFTDKGDWYLDAFVLDGDSRYTLIDSSLTHPGNQWAHIAISYGKGKFRSYVNGKAELSAPVNYSPMASSANTSAGARMNKVHYFHGLLLRLRSTPALLSPDQFLSITSLQKNSGDKPQ
ncbi:MAG: LamG domain-containing protein [Spongiibacteraceae bacterium]|nr:LamG domain-containing protein [Spongiibacteraceae bacterium]